MTELSSVLSSQAPRAVYLAIGTELTSGQITNRNASWISKKLEDAGIPVSWHLAVPDDRALMLEAMQLAQKNGKLVFITGGLGPTTDDFTRDVIAQWWNEPLEWFEPSWTKIVERMAKRGLQAPDSNRQQAYYPKGAQVLSNREGTADGFLLHRDDLTVFVLPGPPREISAVWEDHVAPWLHARFGSLKPIRPLKWQVLGRSEAELGEWVEEAVKGSGLLTGYRASAPYVEIKIWIPAGLTASEPKIAAALATLEAKLAPYTVTRNDEDLVEKFFSSFQGDVRFVDGGTHGWLMERLWTWARSSPERTKSLDSRSPEMVQIPPAIPGKKQGDSAEWVKAVLESIPTDKTTFVLGAIHEQQEFFWGMKLIRDGQASIEIFKHRCPYQGFLRERQEKYQVEWLLASATRAMTNA